MGKGCIGDHAKLLAHGISEIPALVKPFIRHPRLFNLFQGCGNPFLSNGFDVVRYLFQYLFQTVMNYMPLSFP